MKSNFCITLEKSSKPLVQNIEFYGSRLQANRVFYALAYALCISDYERITLFLGENSLSVVTIKSNNTNK